MRQGRGGAYNLRSIHAPTRFVGTVSEAIDLVGQSRDAGVQLLINRDNRNDMETLKPLLPLTVSTVDSGNLAASLYTLHIGALDLLKRPLLNVEVFSSLKQMQPNSRTAAAETTSFPGSASCAVSR